MTVTPKRFRPLCGARCRVGTPCEAPAVWDSILDRPRNGRCRMHGGASTGPKTLVGRLRSLANLKQFRKVGA
ncbi:MAG: HGGxSTG domain-containing protein [Proteobacteria bacterium]|nr:HGGxSTG domain-containing protein [Pseudomonadota bacterium]